jgi:hypothetical protein
MKKTELEQSEAVVNQVLDILMDTVLTSSSATTEGAKLRLDVGNLQANVATQIGDGTVTTALQNCFADATAAGATLPQMNGALGQINAIVGPNPTAEAIVQLSVVLALTEASKIIAAMSFTDREGVEQVLATMNAAFEPAIENAADTNGASDVYIALIALQSQVVQYLLLSEQPLPFLVEYQAARSLPSLTLAMRLYADVTDVETLADELKMQNVVINPAFMPAQGIALSAP